jgi:glycosyltransferase involved in cell wall biosynthesis
VPDADTVVFVPAWNEERSLPAVLAELHAGLPAADVLVIDDGSTDDTAAVATAHGAIVVSFGENRGLRAGIAAGYQEAFDRGYAFCGRVDADGQHPVDELARLLELVRSDSCDVAVGSPTGMRRRPRGDSGSACSRRRCTSGSGARSGTRRAGWRRRTGQPCPSWRGPMQAARPRSRRCCA